MKIILTGATGDENINNTKKTPLRMSFCGADETRTRDLRRDRPVF